MDEFISKKALKDLGAECIAKRDENGNLIPLGSIDSLPSVSTEKTGRGEYVQYDFDPRIGNWHCSECRNIIFQGVEKKGIHNEVIYNFCPWCGARMIEPQESEE